MRDFVQARHDPKIFNSRLIRKRRCRYEPTPLDSNADLCRSINIHKDETRSVPDLVGEGAVAFSARDVEGAARAFAARHPETEPSAPGVRSQTPRSETAPTILHHPCSRRPRTDRWPKPIWQHHSDRISEECSPRACAHRYRANTPAGRTAHRRGRRAQTRMATGRIHPMPGIHSRPGLHAGAADADGDGPNERGPRRRAWRRRCL